MSADLDKQLEQGLAHHQSGRLQDAEAAYRAVLRAHPDHAQALYLLSVLALQVGNPTAAMPLIGRAVELAPSDPEFHNIHGEVQLALGKPEPAVASYRRAIELHSGHAGANNNLGNALRELGRLHDAAASYRRAIEIDPQFVLSYNNLGIVCKELGDLDQALKLFERALALVPHYVEAQTNLGNTLLAQGRVDEAVAMQRKAVAQRPDYAEAQSNLGNALRAHDRPDEAIDAYRLATTLAPQFAMAHYNLGTALDEAGRPADAVSCFERALAIDPNYAEAHNNLGNALDKLGRQADAAAHYRRAIEIRPHYAEAHRNLTRVSPDEEHGRVIQRLLQTAELSDTDAMHCHSALANVLQRSRAYDQAFEHARSANEIKRRSLHYDADAHTQYVDRLIAVFSRQYFDNLSGGSESERPVFVLGMPRSGTSLVEQILASHPRVYGAGELPSLGRFEQRLRDKQPSRYPDCMPMVEASLLRKLAKQYLDELDGFDTVAIRVTDKMPSNFLRIGLIRTLFPRARIIHCRRNALDTCTSNYLHFFAEGNDYSFDLTELGRFYLDYERLMNHWHAMLPDNIIDVQYEDMVDEQETQSRRLVEFVGLDWDSRCLSFFDNDRAVNNFSSQQVRKPIYSSSVERWRRYENELQPLVAILGSRAVRPAARPDNKESAPLPKP